VAARGIRYREDGVYPNRLVRLASATFWDWDNPEERAEFVIDPSDSCCAQCLIQVIDDVLRGLNPD
jgi:hypothetical protein